MANITIPLMGGLGNQLFQISAGLYIEKNLNRKVFFSKSILENSSVGTKRFLEVDELIKAYDCSKNLPQKLFFARLKNVIKNGYCVIEKEPGELLYQHINNWTRYFIGYFQSLDSVTDVAFEIEMLFRKSQFFRVLYESPLTQRIAVHIRLGDYRSQKVAKFHGLTDVNYYIQAIDHLNSAFGIDKILVVSDEPTIAKDVLCSRLSATKYEIQISDSRSGLKDLSKISSSAFIVGSNSTFSWWGAWLASTRFNSRVVMPTPWFANPLISGDKLMDSKWTLLKRTFNG